VNAFGEIERVESLRDLGLEERTGEMLDLRPTVYR
jgi:hypothetical protein